MSIMLQPHALTAERAPSLAARLALHTLRKPGATAFTWDDGRRERSFTWNGLHYSARAIGATLQQCGSQGTRAVVSSRSPLEFALGFFGCLYAGWVPIPGRPVAFQGGIATADSGAESLTWVSVDDLLTRGVFAEWTEPVVRGLDAAFVRCHAQDNCRRMTGTVVTHAALEALLSSMAGQRSPERVVSIAPLYTDSGLIQLLLAAYTGAQLVVGATELAAVTGHETLLLPATSTAA